MATRPATFLPDMKKKPKNESSADEFGPNGNASDLDELLADAIGVPADEDVTDEGDEEGEGDSAAAVESGAEQEIAALSAALAAQKDKYLRAMADFENVKKRLVRERGEAETTGMGRLIKGILDSLDDLGRFAHLDPTTADTKTVVDGVELVERKLLKTLAGQGLELVNPVNAPFDPAFHEALTTVPAASADEDHVVAQVYQVGYVFNGQLLRPARVVVKQWKGDDSSGQG
jgi:molecular chaperone GrpE